MVDESLAILQTLKQTLCPAKCGRFNVKELDTLKFIYVINTYAKCQRDLKRNVLKLYEFNKTYLRVFNACIKRYILNEAPNTLSFSVDCDIRHGLEWSLIHPK